MWLLKNKARMLKEHNKHVEDDTYDSEYAPSDDLMSLHSNDEEEFNQSKRHYASFIPERDMEHPIFELGMRFSTADDFKKAVKQYSILNRKVIHLYTNEKWRVRAKCKKPCGWFGSINRAFFLLV